MKYLLFLLLFLQISATKIDSLNEIISKTDNISKKASIHLQLAGEYKNTNINDAVNNSLKAIDYFKSIKENDSLGKAHNRLGMIYIYADRQEEALKEYFNALENYQTANNKKGVIRTYNKIGSVYNSLDQLDNAFKYYKMSLDLSLQIEDSLSIGNAYNNLGIIHWKRGEIDSSLNYMLTSMQISKDLKDSTGLISSYNNIAMLHEEKDRFELSIGYYNRAVKLADKFNESWDLANSLNNRAVLHIKLRDTNKALNDLKKSLAVSNKINANILISDANFILSTIHEARGDYKRALETYKEFNSISDSIKNQEVAEKIANIQKDHNIKQKIKTIEGLTVENKVQLYLIIALFLLLLIIIALILVYRKKYIENKILNEKLSHKNKKLEEMYDSRSKFFTLISHDLKAPVNNLSNLSNVLRNYYLDMEKDEIDATIDQLKISSDNLMILIDNILNWARTQNDSLNYEPKKIDLGVLIKDCIRILEPSAQEKNIKLKYTSDVRTIIADDKLLSVSLRNLISNAIKFSNENSEVLINTKSDESNIIIEVIDEGIGIEESRLENLFNSDVNTTTLGTNYEKGSGLGLLITKEFIQKSSGELLVDSREDKGSKFTIKLPPIQAKV